MTDSHAMCSPSAGDRWSICTASIEANKPYPDSPGRDALEGTRAHDLLERCIKESQHPTTLEPQHPAVEGVSLSYDIVASYLDNPEFQVFSEVKVQLTPDCWGTADIVIISPYGEMVVLDYKNGFTIVEPDCVQLLIYAGAAFTTLGNAGNLNGKEPITKITTVIVQPNGIHSDGPDRRLTRTVEEVFQELEKKVMPALESIRAGITSFTPSDKGCMWCEHGRQGNCKTRDTLALEKVGAYFDPLGTLEVPTTDGISSFTDEQVATILEGEGLLLELLKGCKARAMKTLQSGGTIPGLKLIRGSANRKFNFESEEEIETFLIKELKFKKSQIYKQSLLGPAPIESVIKKLKRGGAKLKLFNENVIKPEGKLKLVSESHKSPAVEGFFKPTVDPLKTPESVVPDCLL